MTRSVHNFTYAMTAPLTCDMCKLWPMWLIRIPIKTKRFVTKFHFELIHHLRKWVANGPLTRYVKLRVAHAPGMLGTFFPTQTSKETASYRSQHASRHVRHARAVVQSGSLTRGNGENVPSIPSVCATRNFTYLVRGPWHEYKGSMKCFEQWSCNGRQ